MMDGVSAHKIKSELQLLLDQKMEEENDFVRLKKWQGHADSSEVFWADSEGEEMADKIEATPDILAGVRDMLAGDRMQIDDSKVFLTEEEQREALEITAARKE